MTLDSRLRRGLHDESDTFLRDLDEVGPALQVMRRGRRRLRRRRTGAVLGLTCLVGAMLVAGDLILESIRDRGDLRPAASHESSPQPGFLGTPLDGIFTARITVRDGVRAGLSQSAARSLAGFRQMTLSFGLVRQVHPSSFATVPVNGTFEVAGDTLTIRDDGNIVVLTWTLRGDELRLRVVDDSRRAEAARRDRVVWEAAWTRME
jgi:hypothetical protein